MGKEERDSLFHEMVNSPQFEEMVAMARSCAEPDLHALRYAEQMENAQRQVHLGRIKCLLAFLTKCYARAGTELPKSVKELFR